MRGTPWLSLDSHWSILQTPTMILHSSICQENNRLLQQKSAQMGNNLAEQQVNNNNKAKPK